MAKDLYLKLNLIDNVSKALGKIQQKGTKMQEALNKGAEAQNKVIKNAGKATEQAEKLSKATQKASTHAGKLNLNFKNASASVSLLTRRVAALTGGYLTLMEIKKAIDISDQITAAENKLNYVNAQNLGAAGVNQDGTYSATTLNATNEQMEKMYASAQKVRTGYMDMVSNVSKSMVLANGAFKGNIDNAIRFQEIMSEAYSVGGASAAEQASSMYQMIQALGSGVLQGDELRSVREGAATAYQAIERFAQGIYNTDESLKELASQGKITSDIVVSAILNAGDEMDKAFANTKMTFAQAWIMMKNTAVESFRGLLESLNNMLNSDFGKKLIITFQNIIRGIVIAINWIIKAFVFIGNVVSKVFDFIQQHAKAFATALVIVSGVIFTLLIPSIIAWIHKTYVAIVTTLTLKMVSMQTALTMAAGWLLAHWPILLIIAALIAVIVIVIRVSDSFQDACGNIAGAVWVVGAFILNLAKSIGIAIMNVLTFLVNLVIVIATTIGEVAGNLVIAVINGWNAIWEAGKAVAHNIGIAFTNGFYNAKAAGWDFVANVCSGILKVANLINSVLGIFGMEINTSGLENMMNTARDNAQANRDKTRAYEDVGNALKSGWNSNEFVGFTANTLSYKGMDTFQDGWASNAFDKGYKWGSSKGEALQNFVSGLTGKLSGSNLANLTGSSLNTDVYDPTGSLGGLDDIDKNTGKTANNTKDIKDTLDLTNEDLSFLRKIAELEWKKEFTTANINVAMTNNNNVNKTTDLDGIATQLAKTLEQELATVAAGSYS